MADGQDFSYIGSELDLFAEATNWKAHWGRALRPLLGPDVLDVGAGKGSTARVLCDAGVNRWVALEPDAQLAACIRRDVACSDLPPSCEVRVGTLDAVGRDERFDTILYIDVLEHIEADGAELARAARFLKPTGRIIVLSPAHSWLFTPFDTALGHFRRYNRESLLAVTPPELVTEKLFYLDSVGMMASLANRLVLKAAQPTRAQIHLWDKWMVPVSRWVDPMTGYRLGKSIVGVWRRADRTASATETR